MTRHFCITSFALLLTGISPHARAICIDVVDLSVELPATVMTDGGLQLSYEFDLRADTYLLSISGPEVNTDQFGPFPLTMSCGTPAPRWENDDFLITEAGCGTFCWYARIYALTGQIGAERYQRIERPLAFHTETNLLAFYLDKDLIRVTNLLTGASQDLLTAYECEYYSGLCFDSVSLERGMLSYRWISADSGPEDGVITSPLSPGLLR